MNIDLAHQMHSFSRLKVLVIGEAMLDSYLEGTTERLCREAPVPVVNLLGCKDAPGGAANTAVNLSRLGSEVYFLSVVGDDAEGDLLRQTLKEQGVRDDYMLTCPNRQTLAKRRVMAASQMVVRIDQGSTGPVDKAVEQRVIKLIGDLLPRCEAVIVSDYGYGLLTPRVIKTLAGWQARAPRVMVVDARDLLAYRELGATAVKPNYEEVIGLLGIDKSPGRQNRAEQIAAKGEQVLDITGAQVAAVTLDTEGALIFERSSAPYRTYARPVPYSKAAGAG